ncbi:RNA repair transcriptional activator RtcR family protein [Clostridium sp.]|uniref:RNA repair transcriptional activator RtcR family protein n=1 Tax=Clostridium sp. TaxID=1506 RepID=UPI00284C8044|nr:RNA repair transcriptional activator RtcR family protein [Clostridium sp.]MDR3596508.1 RNA repair transcriptional activator RtcR family protein [Clostridium sp.]
MAKAKNILISFIGTNDAGELKGKTDGAILTALTNQKFDETILFWTKSSNSDIDYLKIADYLKSEIKKRRLAKKVTTLEFPVKSVTDHNQIYIQLKNISDALPKENSHTYTAAISSGTPAMQVCWILLAESGDFSEINKLNLVQVNDPKFGKSENIPVKIDTALPKIIRLKEEMDNLKKDLIPSARITINWPGLTIGDITIPLSPVELSYYMYFAERVLGGLGDEKFFGLTTPNYFLNRILELHAELFPGLESNRQELENIKKKNYGLSISTFRGNISKVNRKIKKAINNESITASFEIASTGGRGYKFYGIKATKEKLKIE